jgi:elongation factor G
MPTADDNGELQCEISNDNTYSGGIRVKKYTTDKIRNIGFFGHGGTGKTTMSESMLFLTGAIDRFGKVNDGNTTSDFEPDEQKRGMSIYTSTIPVEHNNHKLNVLDTPGFLDFVAQAQSALAVVETGVFFVSAQAGVEVGLERIWKLASEKKMSRFFLINRLDKENTSFDRSVDSIAETLKLEGAMVTLHLPIGVADKFSGIVDLVEMKAYTYSGGKSTVGEIPADMKDKAEEYREKLVEAAAGVEESLMEKFFEGALSEDEIRQGLAKGIAEGSLIPVLCGAAETSVGTDLLMDALIKYGPAPDKMGEFKAIKPKTGDEVMIKPVKDAPVSAMVFKTTTDPYVGRLSFIRVLSGKMTGDMTLYNPNKDTDEKIAGIMIFRGKEHMGVDEVEAGDIITVAKLTSTETNDTLCSKDNSVQFPKINYPEPLMSLAVYPKSKGDEDKLGAGLSKLTEEDPTFTVKRDTVTKETVISGVGDLQLSVLMDRLKRKFNVEVDLKTPKVPYKETIKGKTKVEHKYKKQTGGRGQYGHVVLEIEPTPRDAGYEFVDKIVGGVVPRNFIPSVDKGLRKALEEGVLAGYPFVDVRVALVFGSYHTVDSSDMAFQIASSMAFKKGVPEANPILLEPIYEIEVVVPDSFTGDVIGDLNGRRGRILNMTPLGDGMQSIKALVPLAELRKYAIDLRSMTQGRGVFSMKYSTYEEVPAQIAEQVIAEAKKEQEE